MICSQIGILPSVFLRARLINTYYQEVKFPSGDEIDSLHYTAKLDMFSHLSYNIESRWQVYTDDKAREAPRLRAKTRPSKDTLTYRYTYTNKHLNNLSLIAFKPILAPTHVYFRAVTSVYPVWSHRKDVPLLLYHGTKSSPGREKKKKHRWREEWGSKFPTTGVGMILEMYIFRLTQS